MFPHEQKKKALKQKQSKTQYLCTLFESNLWLSQIKKYNINTTTNDKF